MTDKQNIAISGILFAIIGGIAVFVDTHESAGVGLAVLYSVLASAAFGVAGAVAMALRLIFMNWFIPMLAIGMICILIYGILGGLFFEDSSAEQEVGSSQLPIQSTSAVT
ncbi:MAG: hypothetical protein AAFR71_04670 [Pseudomonadota bacterium]